MTSSTTLPLAEKVKARIAELKQIWDALSVNPQPPATEESIKQGMYELEHVLFWINKTAKELASQRKGDSCKHVWCNDCREERIYNSGIDDALALLIKKE